MPKKYNTLVNDILEFLLGALELLPRPFEAPYAHIQRIRRLPYKKYQDKIRELKKQRYIKVVIYNDQQCIELTERGKLEILLRKASISKTEAWDHKWRIVIFDIPEQARKKRDNLRSLLKQNNFYRLQNSVFINPYPFNRQAITYLKDSGLIKYIRFLRVDDIDDGTDLKKKFKLE